MRILWVSNSPIGPAADILNQVYGGSSGGWIQSEYDKFDNKQGESEFFFLTTLASVKKNNVLKKTGDKGTLYCINAPRIQYGIIPSRRVIDLIDGIIQEIQPDIIQIWGTETWLSYAVSCCSPQIPKVIFVQGLIGMHQRYLGGYFGNMPEDKIYGKNIPLFSRLKEMVRHVNFKKQALIETKTLCNCGNVIIDNDFSKAFCRSISSDINCFEHSLEPNKVFFTRRWEAEKCKRFSVFTVYGSSAEKGTQNLLKALSVLKKSFPDIELVIPGPYDINSDGRLSSQSKNPFQIVLKNMIRLLDLEKNVRFTGKLNPEQMSDEMVKANVFVNTSCMEVHALSLREALTVGMPCISSMCGSVNGYLKHGYNGFIYRYEEYEVLAFYIKKLFENRILEKEISENAVKTALTANENSLSLAEIYTQIIKAGKQ